MNYYEQEFTIDGYDNITFRFKKVSPIDIFALANVAANMETNTNSFKEFITSVLEMTEMIKGGKVLSVKEKGRDIYFPAKIEMDFKAWNEITKNFIQIVLNPTFTESNRSTNEL